MTAELTKESVTEILARSVVVGQMKGAFSIKDGAYLYKAISQLRKQDDHEIPEKDCFEALVRGVILANTKGSFSLEEVELIERTVAFLEKEKLITVQSK